MSYQTKLALQSTRVGNQEFRGWGLSGPLNHVQHYINNNGTCWCRKPDNQDMVFCKSKNCPHGWFHFKCLNLTRKEADRLPDDWICTFCTN